MKAIHMEQKYQEHQDNIVTFNHSMNFTMGPREVRAKSTFSTVFESTSLDWDLQLHKHFDRLGIAREPRWAITLLGVGARDLYPQLTRLHFQMNVIDSEGVLVQTLKYFIDGALYPQQVHDGRTRMAHNKKFSTDLNTTFCNQLKEVMVECRKKEYLMQLETRIEFRKNDLGDVKCLVSEGAPLVTDMKEFYFDAINNRSRHDLKLKTANGGQSLMVNKEILCLASPFFRQQLKEGTKEYTLTAECIESVEICLTYMLTSRYKKPAQMSPRLALELYQLATLWKVFEPKVLKNSIESQLYEELRKNHEDFSYVVNLLVATEEGQFVNVQTCSIATIIFYHFHEFARLMIHGNHPMKERLAQRREFLRPSLTMQVKRGFVGMHETACFVKYLPVLGQD